MVVLAHMLITALQNLCKYCHEKSLIKDPMNLLFNSECQGLRPHCLLECTIVLYNFGREDFSFLTLI